MSERRRPRLRFLADFAVGLVLLATAAPAVAQTTELEESRRRLEQIRAEREQLRRQQDRLEGQARDAQAELRNIERQRESTNRIVNEIDTQIGGLGSELERASAQMILTEDNLAERRAVLERRLVDIYKRGPLYTFQVLLTAESFGDLLARYKYLFLTSRQDRSLVQDIEALRNRTERARRELLDFRTQLDRTRQEREAELQSYARLAQERSTSLRNLRRSTQSTQQRLTQLERDEQRLNDLLAALEARRADAARTGRATTAPAPGALTTADIGRLDWPVEGTILYPFGRERRPSGATINWNGIGIGTAEGTPVRAVAAGRVAIVQRLSTYGLTVIVEHGDSHTSLYMQLGTTSVAQGQSVDKGQVIGTVGGGGTDRGPHLHFEIRQAGGLALDPASWLRGRR
ncbi:MAG TPA: peptidoglycan DD-metalloendopeptidase family protein [Gemmatimonadales bacterium]|nr:peptidoglycan DD-metalloendopeptidase family protein [Gemmatimonadales bacterium]